MVQARAQLRKDGQVANYRLGQVAGMRVSADRSAIATAFGVWALWAAVGVLLFGVPWRAASVGGVAAVALHWLSVLVHQLGHAWAARRVGYPPVALHFWGPFSAIGYPSDEPVLPDAVHLQRALGGPLASLGLSVLGLLWVLVARDAGAAWRWLAWFFFLDNFGVLTLQAALPLGLNDGAEIWRRLSARRRR